MTKKSGSFKKPVVRKKRKTAKSVFRIRKRTQRHIQIIGILILLLLVPIIWINMNSQPSYESSSVSESPVPVVTSSVPSSTVSSKSSESAQNHGWELMLVNYQYPLKDYEPELRLVSNNSEVDVRIYDDLVKLLEAGRADGITLFPCSGYRSYELQVKLFTSKVDKLKQKGLSQEEAETTAATEVARPGTSEHITGLCADIVSIDYQRLDSGFADTETAQWLADNAWKYGFILRFPKGKEHITGVIYEPWHYRFVGKEAAREIHEKGITLEEYLEMNVS